jgi:hypothetical protein
VVIVATIALMFSRALGQLVVLIGHFEKQGFASGRELRANPIS